MTGIVLAGLYAVFVWWFSTGAIIFLDNRNPGTFRASLTVATVVLAGALYTIGATAGSAGLPGVYAAFTASLLAWGWLELSFYTGAVTGLKSGRCHPGCTGWKHFGHALAASLYHEIAIVVLGLAVGALTWGQPNKVALWTFLLLTWMHQSARLNVFLGVRNIDEEFLPPHMAWLKTFIRRAPMNPLCPVSVTLSTTCWVFMCIQIVRSPAGSAIEASYVLTGSLMGLAILEHWFLMLPLHPARLWRWGLPKSLPKGPALTHLPVPASPTVLAVAGD